MHVKVCGHVMVVRSFMSSYLRHLVKADLSHCEWVLASCTFCLGLLRDISRIVGSRSVAHSKIFLYFIDCLKIEREFLSLRAFSWKAVKSYLLKDT